jgi:hypothetical protein
MPWISKHKKVWRVAILVVGLAALVGPWGFDETNVPAEYTCSPPSVRLEGDFCGHPLEGFRILGWFVIGIIFSSVELVTGAIVFSDWVRQLLYSMYLLLLVLPLFSTLLLLLRGDHRRLQIFSIAAWGLAAGMGLVIGLLNYPRLFWVLWGPWLYIGLGVSALTLEVLSLRRVAIAHQLGG